MRVLSATRAWIIVGTGFIIELAKATWDVIRAVYGRPDVLRPAILEVPLEVKSAGAITLFANMISLTPGTTTLDVSRDEHALYVHCLHTDDPERTIRDLKASLENRVKEVLP